MRRHLLFVLISFMFVSCASVLNSEKMSVTVYTEHPADVIYRTDTFCTELKNNYNGVKLDVFRSKEALKLTLLSDSLKKSISISSRNSLAYYLNAYPFWPGFIIDHSSSRRYTYKNILMFDENLNLIQDAKLTTHRRKDLAARKSSVIGNFNAPRKGDFYYYLSFPFVYLSLNTIKPEGHSRITRGSFLGLSSGFDYYYKENKFIHLVGSLSTSIISGCGYSLPYDWDGESYADDGFSIYNINVSHNHRSKYFSFGYGLSYGYINYHKDVYRISGDFKMEYNLSRSDYSYILDCDRYKYTTLGLVFNGYCYLSKGFSVGIVYKPNLLRLKSQSDNPFKYEHQITLDFAFRLKLLSGK